MFITFPPVLLRSHGRLGHGTSDDDLVGHFLGPAGLGAAFVTLLVGSPAITFIGAAGAAIAVSLPRGGLLVPILILPLSIPVLIFGVGASYAVTSDIDPFLPPFLLLVAITLFFAVVGPVAAAVALRQADD